MIEKRKPVIINGRFAAIRLTHGLFAIVDCHRFNEVNQHRWKAVRSSWGFYAARTDHSNGHEKTIYLSRLIANTPPDKDCHHKNRYTLDCRESNLENKTKPAHRAEHGKSL